MTWSASLELTTECTLEAIDQNAMHNFLSDLCRGEFNFCIDTWPLPFVFHFLLSSSWPFLSYFVHASASDTFAVFTFTFAFAVLALLTFASFANSCRCILITLFIFSNHGSSLSIAFTIHCREFFDQCLYSIVSSHFLLLWLLISSFWCYWLTLLTH